jgi:predicted permease
MPDWKPEIRGRLIGLRLAPTREAAIVEELSQYLDDCHEELLAGGATPADAYQQTLAELTGSEALARELRHVERPVAPEPLTHGTNRRINMVADLWQDLRFGARMLVKQPGFTLIAVITLALGIGANAAIFSLLDAVLLKTLPVKRPEQLVFLENEAPEFKRSSNISYAEFERLRMQGQELSGACFFSYTTRVNANVSGQSEAVEGQMVSGGFFSVLGVPAMIGRTFTEDDDKESAEQAVAVISYRYWQRRFGSNPAVIGESVNLNGVPFTIIGVTPPEFLGVILGNAPDVFLPSVAGERILPRRFRFRDSSLPFILARLKPNLPAPQAAAALTLTLQQSRLAEASGSSEKQQAIQKQTVNLPSAAQGFSELRRQYSQPLRLLLAAVALVLLIACANVANLLLARATARRKEIAMRLALGASRFRLIRQLLVESLLLALIGGATGLLLASWCSGLLVAVVTSSRNPVTSGSQLSLNVPLDARVFGFTALVSLLAAVVFGLAPAWRATRLELSPVLKDNASGLGGGGRVRWGQMLVVMQVALSLMLLVGAGLFIRSLINLKSADLGFQRENVLLFSVDPQLIGYRREQIGSLYRRMLERIGTVPGVQSVTLARQGLLSGGGTQGSIKIPGHTPPADENSFSEKRGEKEWNAPWFAQVGPRYFETLGMTLLRGRDFTAQDHETSMKVAVINEAFAHYYFGDEDPLGQRFDRGNDGGEVEIIGVVKDAKANFIQERTPRTFYVPFLQDPGAWRETTFQIRTVGEPMNLANTIRSVVQEIEPNLALFRVRTLAAQIDESIGQERLVTTLASLFGLLALLLTCAGLYGVLSYSVNQRTSEIGIRMALGAQTGVVLRLVIKQGMGLTLLGIVIGIGASFALTRLLTNLLFGVNATDPLTYDSVTVLLLVIALLACWFPARRATKVDPLIALRNE